MAEYITLRKAMIPAFAEAYIRWVETTPTPEICKCEWAVHPDDVTVQADKCRLCARVRDDAVHQVGDDPMEFMEDTHNFRGRRLRLKEEDPLCPVHNKVGRVAGFFEWLAVVQHGEAGVVLHDQSQG